MRRLDAVWWAAAVILAAILVAAVFAPWVAPHGPNEQDITLRLKPPGTPGHPLGTDEVGRDILSRLIHGARVSLLVGVIAVVLSCPVGLLVGVVAGKASRAKRQAHPDKAFGGSPAFRTANCSGYRDAALLPLRQR